MNKEEYKIISHSLGINEFTRGELPEEFFRNHFQAGEEHDSYTNLENLVIKGFMKKREVFEQPVYNVTDKGVKEFRKNYNIII